MDRDYAVTMEGTMTEFADIFAYELSTIVYLASSVAVLMVAATALLWMGREPAAISAFEFAPEYGL
jgi:hypothetical protein